jgi:uncharacterized protein (DUF488 family)
MSKLYTIGFTKKSSEVFFDLLRKVNISNIIDVRLHNESQLAGFSKKDDLKYFLKEICHCAYEHRPDWAPSEEILEAYKKKKIGWEQYEIQFIKIINEKHIEKNVDINKLNGSCLLCSEPKADKCHRRIVAEYLKQHFDALHIYHL